MCIAVRAQPTIIDIAGTVAAKEFLDNAGDVVGVVEAGVPAAEEGEVEEVEHTGKVEMT